MADTHFYHTYVPNAFAAANPYPKTPYTAQVWHDWPEFRRRLPEPFWHGHESTIACYWKVWELAHKNRRRVQPGSGFVSDFSATAFNDSTFLWDSAFIALFGRYGRRAWDFQATLNNFYAKQHPDGFICRQIREENGTECFQRFDPAGTGPNVFAWTEWTYFTDTGDDERLARVFPALVAYHQWCRRYRTWADGSYWATGWSTGMDNQPRLPGGYIDREPCPPGGHHAWYEHGHYTWSDACLQALLSARVLLRMADTLGQREQVADLEAEAEALSGFVTSKLWDERTGFYHDLRRDGSRSPVESIGAFWALLAGAVDGGRHQALVAALEDPARFNRTHRVPSLSAATPEYDPTGGYWCGGVWPPTNYMVLAGLTARDEHALAHRIGRNHVEHVVAAFEATGTLWENYAPDVAGKGCSAKDFVGWSGLPPVAVLFEHVFGLRPDVPAGRLVWDVRLTEAHGVERYPWGRDGTLSLHCAARGGQDQAPEVRAETDTPLTLEVRWAGGYELRELRPSR